VSKALESIMASDWSETAGCQFCARLIVDFGGSV